MTVKFKRFCCLSVYSCTTSLTAWWHTFLSTTPTRSASSRPSVRNRGDRCLLVSVIIACVIMSVGECHYCLLVSVITASVNLSVGECHYCLLVCVINACWWMPLLSAGECHHCQCPCVCYVSSLYAVSLLIVDGITVVQWWAWLLSASEYHQCLLVRMSSMVSVISICWWVRWVFTGECDDCPLVSLSAGCTHSCPAFTVDGECDKCPLVMTMWNSILCTAVCGYSVDTQLTLSGHSYCWWCDCKRLSVCFQSPRQIAPCLMCHWLCNIMYFIIVVDKVTRWQLVVRPPLIRFSCPAV